jgi:hypothetical protein
MRLMRRSTGRRFSASSRGGGNDSHAARTYRVRNTFLAAVWTLAALMVIAGLIESPGPAMRWTGVLEMVIGLFGFSGLGVLIVVRARNPIGWFFCAAGLLMAYQYDSDHVLTEFGRRLKAGVGIDRLTEDSLSVISQTVQPSSVGLWIRE